MTAQLIESWDSGAFCRITSCLLEQAEEISQIPPSQTKVQPMLFSTAPFTYGTLQVL